MMKDEVGQEEVQLTMGLTCHIQEFRSYVNHMLWERVWEAT